MGEVFSLILSVLKVYTFERRLGYVDWVANQVMTLEV